MSWLVDPDAVAAEYESERGLRERVLAHRELVAGPDDDKVVRARIVAGRPRRLLEVGPGLGEPCAWARAEFGAEVVAVERVIGERQLPHVGEDAGRTCSRSELHHSRRGIPRPRSPSSHACSSRAAL